MKGVSRRDFLKKTSMAGAGAAAAGAVLGFPHVASAAAKTRVLRVQSSWSAGTTGYKVFEN